MANPLILLGSVLILGSACIYAAIKGFNLLTTALTKKLPPKPNQLLQESINQKETIKRLEEGLKEQSNVVQEMQSTLNLLAHRIEDLTRKFTDVLESQTLARNQSPPLLDLSKQTTDITSASPIDEKPTKSPTRSLSGRLLMMRSSSSSPRQASDKSVKHSHTPN